jgi:hypothetical protein
MRSRIEAPARLTEIKSYSCEKEPRRRQSFRVGSRALRMSGKQQGSRVQNIAGYGDAKHRDNAPTD